MLYAIFGLIVILIIVLIVYNVRAGTRETVNNESSAKATNAEVTQPNEAQRNEAQPTYVSQYKRPETRDHNLAAPLHSPRQEGIQSDDEFRRALRQFQAGEHPPEEQIDGHIDDQDYRDALRRMNRQ
ncbi:hypothetical protein PP175_14645 [Aneurinibacillus sp. Ricciae_BoGa-3]|uniref:hypothetical protein n=1 Tax=Aneurinibacillus sp. Ricciae_BoGa-3 TaxID=3022697 RepID=UPI00234097E9|nr:hypothetical protein [Aneurinibacillus sp. Ricciae_BoGa-3]WCK52670.1 hypothetical protein PP175_14645 [Aneurinibacillus sp. Ricciae_BoGa-3]